MKIAVNTSCLLAPMTGIGRYTFNLFSEIARKPECEMGYLYGLAWREQLFAPVPQYQKMSSVVKTAIPFARTMRKFLQGQILGRKLVSDGYDLYHEPNFFALSYEKPVVTTIHDLSAIKYPQFHTADRVRIYEKTLLGAMEKSEYLITVSEFVRQDIIETFGISADKIVSTLLGVEKDFYPYCEAEAATVLESYHLLYKSYFLVVSTQEPRKNFQLVVNAYMRLSDVIKERYPLVIVGMKGWETGQFDKAFDKLKRQGYLRLLGYVPNGDLPALYSAAKLFLYPSFYEGFGLPPLEAMACGTPVITSDVSSLPEVVGNAGLMVSPYDVEGLSEKILAVVEDAAVSERLAKRSIERARLFTWERCAEQTMEVYRRLL